MSDPHDRLHLVRSHESPLSGTPLPDPLGWRLAAELGGTPGVTLFESEEPGGRVHVLEQRDRLQEAEDRIRALEGLTHPQVQSVAGAGWLLGKRYRADRPVDGQGLADLLREKGPLPLERVQALGLSLAQVLVELHARGVVHGHLHLDAVRVRFEADWLPILVDLPLILEGERYAHAAPEVQLGRRPDPRSDVFGLGYVLLSLLRGTPADGEGRSPHWLSGAPGPAVTLPEALEVPEALAELLAAMVDRDPAKRPRTAQEVADRMARVRRVEPVAAPSRTGLWVGLAALTLLGLGGLGAVLLRQPPQEEVTAPVAVAPPTRAPAPGEAMSPPMEPPPEEAAVLEDASVTPAPPPAEPATDAPVQQVEPTPIEQVEPTPIEQVEPAPVEQVEPAPVEEVEPPVEEVEPAADEAPAVADVEPAAPLPSRFSGTWTGTSNGRPMTLTLRVSDQGRVSGQVEVRLGAQTVSSPITGTFTPEGDGGRITFTETEGNKPTTYSGTISGSGISGGLSASGRSRGDFSVTR